jgi:RHS repeat-associated protein
MDLWRYIKDEDDPNNPEFEDRGWVDFVKWTGAGPLQPPEDWDTITYKYDASGRRIEKEFDNDCRVKYIYDGGNVIAEYDGVNNLLRKYVHGAGVDEPVCMIDTADNNEVYYYHFDGLGSVVVLSDSEGDAVQSYEYSIYGQVAAFDPNFTSNPYMFTGRRFDIETGLYYYRARYYNPHIGRFMQTDPVGYSDGINWYRYCGNNPVNWIDPWGNRAWWTAIAETAERIAGAIVDHGGPYIQGAGEIASGVACIAGAYALANAGMYQLVPAATITGLTMIGMGAGRIADAAAGNNELEGVPSTITGITVGYLFGEEPGNLVSILEQMIVNHSIPEGDDLLLWLIDLLSISNWALDYVPPPEETVSNETNYDPCNHRDPHDSNSSSSGNGTGAGAGAGAGAGSGGDPLEENYYGSLDWTTRVDFLKASIKNPYFYREEDLFSLAA